MSWRAIDVDYTLYVEVNNLIVFLPNWVSLIILKAESPKIWGIGTMIT